MTVILPNIQKYSDDHNLTLRIFGGEPSLTEAQFTARYQPNELAHYQQQLLIATESLAKYHFENLSKEIEKNHILWQEINQVPPIVAGGNPPTRDVIEADRTVIYFSEVRSLELFKQLDPTFVDLPVQTLAQRNARNAAHATRSNALQANVITQWRTQNAVIQLTDEIRLRAQNTPDPINNYLQKIRVLKTESMAIATAEHSCHFHWQYR